MNPAQHIAEQLQCSELAAGEICATAKALAQGFVAIYDTYDLTHVLEAKRAIRKLGITPPKKLFRGDRQQRPTADKAERVLRNWRALSRPATTLFKHCQNAVEAADQFRTAVDIAHCQNYSGVDAVLTVVLSALHEARRLPSPDKVGDGRLAYESMRRDYTLLQSLGVLGS